MKIFVQFDSQVRRLAGCKQMALEVDENASLQEIVQQVANSGTSALQSTLLDEHDALRPSILVFLNNELVANDQVCVLREGAELTLTTLISGG